MKYEQFLTAIRPKMHGSANLAELLPSNRDFYIILSSVTGIIGNRGQGNYTAGNVFQDALARHLTSCGAAASSIDLANVMSAGYVAENHGDEAAVTEIEMMSLEELYALIEYHIDFSKRRALSPETCQTVMGVISTGQFAERGVPQPAFMADPLFKQLHTAREVTETSKKDKGGLSIVVLLASAKSLDAAASSVAQAITQKMSDMMSLVDADIDTSQTLQSYGVDSLVAVGIRSWIKKEILADISVLDILGRGSIDDLSMIIATQSKLVNIAAEDTEAS
jgi:KR domain/Phosphopantetheine attachment site